MSNAPGKFFSASLVTILIVIIFLLNAFSKEMGKSNVCNTPRSSYVTILNRSQVLDLKGEWCFKVDPCDVGETEEWFNSKIESQNIFVPSSWQIALEDLRDYVGIAWYEREFTVPTECEGKRIAVVFCGVSYYAKIWVNGNFGGGHEGSFLPFDVDITDFVKFDKKNTITGRKIDFPDLCDRQTIQFSIV